MLAHISDPIPDKTRKGTHTTCIFLSSIPFGRRSPLYGHSTRHPKAFYRVNLVNLANRDLVRDARPACRSNPSRWCWNSSPMSLSLALSLLFSMPTTVSHRFPFGQLVGMSVEVLTMAQDGANDVANAWATSVSSRSVTYKQAVSTFSNILKANHTSPHYLHGVVAYGNGRCCSEPSLSFWGPSWSVQGQVCGINCLLTVDNMAVKSGTDLL